MLKKEVVKTKSESGEDLVLDVKRPDTEVIKKAQLEYNKAFRSALEGGSLFRSALDKYLRDQGVWDDAKEKQYQELQKDIYTAEKKLKAGGIKKSEAYKIAVDMKAKRTILRLLFAERNRQDSMTVEGQAENARFNCYVALCTVYNDTGNPYFSSLQDYLDRSNEQASYDVSEKMASMLYGLDSNYEQNLPENQFLHKFGYIDDKNRFINKEGKLTDFSGREIDEEGYYLKDGKRVDLDGNPLDENGELIIEQKPFLDDDGNPIE